jgi:hypothetical protein
MIVKLPADPLPPAVSIVTPSLIVTLPAVISISTPLVVTPAPIVTLALPASIVYLPSDK